MRRRDGPKAVFLTKADRFVLLFCKPSDGWYALTHVGFAALAAVVLVK